MSIPGSASPLLLASTAAAPAGYQVSRSLRFNSADSAYLSRTPGTASNRKTWTWAGWVKRSALGSAQGVFEAGTGSGTDIWAGLLFNSSNQIFCGFANAASNDTYIQTTAVFRDCSAWYHIVLAVDTTNATNTDRVKLYVNNERITVFSDSAYGAQNTDSIMNTTNLFVIGQRRNGAGVYLNGYLADVHFIDGQALTPSSFTEVSATTGQLIPKTYSGTYGTNGFQLKFADNSSNTAATLGKDTSGNGNNWTPVNLSTNTGGPTSVATASGALPIYNTTDTYGAVKGTGTRTDSNSSSIVLAVPMDGTNGGTSFSDQSATIKGSGSAKTITVSGATTSTSQGKYYGSSASFNGSSNLSVASTTDFDFNSINYTIELWFYADSTTISPHSRLFEFSSGVFAAYIYSDRSLYVKGGNVGASGDISFPAGSYFSNQWNHLAVVGYSDGTRTAFLNGVLRSTTGGGNPSGAQSLSINGDTSGSYRWTGYVSDFRVYKGAAKYVGEFNPPSSTQNTTVAVGNDSLVDTPTSFGTDTYVGGEVRGNYATFNPTESSTSGTKTLTNGNLDVLLADANAARLTIPPIQASGKYQWEITIGSKTASYYQMGLNLLSMVYASGDLHTTFRSDGNLSNTLSGSWSGTGVSYTSGDIITVTYDNATNACSFYKNGVFSVTFTVSGTPQASLNFGVFYGGSGNTNYTLNAGQRAFAHPVSGFKALCDTNLPAPLTAKPNTLMDVKLYTGNGSTQTISGLAFSPDLVWLKSRSSGGYAHRLNDTVRGATKELYSNLTSAEFTDASGLTAFNSDGFSVGSTPGYNDNTGTYVAWAWDAGTSTVSNTAGSITSQVRANASAGFSVVTYSTGASSGNQTIGHGLNVTPSLIIHKVYSTTSNWWVYHASTTNTVSKYIQLNSTNATADNGLSMWGAALPTSTVFGANVGQLLQSNQSAVAYCFAPVVGYSSIGSYVGNGTNDGPFVYTGFRPRWVLIKSTGSDDRWTIQDTSRSSYNASTDTLAPNLSSAELANAFNLDINSNGFKVRSTNSGHNTSSVTYIYYAIAENPFQYARAR